MKVLKRIWGWIYAPNVYVDQVPLDPQTHMTYQQEYLEEFDYEVPRTPHTEAFLQTILVSTQNVSSCDFCSRFHYIPHDWYKECCSSWISE